MKMSKMEKRFVNTRWHAQKNVKLIERSFSKLDLASIGETRVLEIGCGAGILAAHLSTTHEMNVVGTDVDPEQIEIARTYHQENENLTGHNFEVIHKEKRYEAVMKNYSIVFQKK